MMELQEAGDQEAAVKGKGLIPEPGLHALSNQDSLGLGAEHSTTLEHRWGVTAQAAHERHPGVGKSLRHPHQECHLSSSAAGGSPRMTWRLS